MPKLTDPITEKEIKQIENLVARRNEIKKMLIEKEFKKTENLNTYKTLKS